MALKRVLSKTERDLLWKEAHFEYGVGAFMCDGPEVDREKVMGQIAFFQECVLLYDDLGWQREDSRLTYQLTMSDEDLARIAGRLKQTATSLLGDLDEIDATSDREFLRIAESMAGDPA